MKKTKTTASTNSTALRTRADATYTAWTAAKADHATKLADWQTKSAAAERGRQAGRSIDGELRLILMGAEIAHLEAEDVAKALEIEAGDALDDAERAEGDALALACSPRALYSTLEEAIEDEKAARDALAAAERTRAECISSARSASAELEERRRSAGLPPPIRLPRPQAPSIGMSIDAPPPMLLEALAILMNDGPPPPAKTRVDRIRMLRREEDDIRVAAELALREREERKKEEDDVRRKRREDHESQREEERANHAAFVAKAEAARREREALIASNKARRAG